MPAAARPGPTGLPVEEVVDAVRAALAGRGLAVLQAAPGAGKTTVVPLRLLDEAWVGGGRIVVLEPRRVAARAAASRMAEMCGEAVGQSVGYRTRDDRRVSAATRIEVVTEGILTRRLQADPSLPGVALVIFDEFHERRLQTDLVLAFTLDARTGLRPDLRILVMSATLAVARVADLLGAGDGDGPVPVVSSEGRSYPVRVEWGTGGGELRTVVPGVVGLTRRALAAQEGDLLVFLPGVGEISRVTRALKDADPVFAPDQTGLRSGSPGLTAGIDILPLHGSLPAAQQDAALLRRADSRRRVVLATDLAETSLTVEGVRVVIDAGLNRGPRFDPGSGLTRLHTSRASRASAEQRAGRAGRTAPGVVYRWWSQAEHAARPAFTEPEILTVDLAALALELAVWGAASNDLRWLDEPPRVALVEGRRLLADLGALDGPGPQARPTAAGRAMAQLPLHPRLARMVLAASEDHRHLACMLAALVEERDIFRSDGGTAVPVDAAERIAVLGRTGGLSSFVDSRALDVVRRRSEELATRTGSGRRATVPASDPTAVGPLLALAYPDRLAQGRGGGRFRLRGGPGVAVPVADPLSSEAYLVIADVTPANPGAVWSHDGRVRLAAAIDEADVEDIGGDDVRTEETYLWVGGELRSRLRRTLGELVLTEKIGLPTPGPALAAALAERVGRDGLGVLGWTDEARALQHRARFARQVLGEGWPEVSDAALLASRDSWLTPRLVSARHSRDLAAIRMSGVLRSVLGPDLSRRLDAVAPTSVELANGRRLSVDYSEDQPTARARAQDLFGVGVHPRVGEGRVPVVLQVLSPAGRPIQVTADLPGFWSGSWSGVRREMAGRYPRHDWPEDPTAAPRPGVRHASRRR